DGKSSQVGIGAELSQVASFLYVVAPVKGSPADQAGVRAGDVIEYIDGKATRDISLYDARQLLNGTPGSDVKLRILRNRALTLTVKCCSFSALADVGYMAACKIRIVRMSDSYNGDNDY